MQKSNNTVEESGKPGTQISVPVTTGTQLTAGQIQTLAARLKGQQNTIGVSTTGSGANLSTLITVPRAISGQSSSGTTAVSLSNTRIISPQAINIIQRQIPASGVVGLSCVTAEGLQQVLQGAPLTLVTTASPEAAVVLEQQRKHSLLQHQRRQQQQQSGATIHHLGPRGLASPISNQTVSLVANMSNVKQSPGAASSLSAASAPLSSSNTISTAIKDVKLPFTTAVTRTAASPITGGPSPKKIKLEEKPAQTSKIASLRQSVSNHKRCKMREVKSKYRDHLTELFYLQAGGNMVEFQTWKKRPTQPLLNFLEGSRLDSDDDDDRLQEKRINDEVKVLTSTGSNIPVATPVAIATTLPPSVSALSQQGSSHILASPFSITNPKFTASAGIDDFLRQLSAYVKAMNSSSTTANSLITSPSVFTSSSELQQHLTKLGDSKGSHGHKGLATQSHQPIPSKSIKSQSTSPGRSRQAITSVYENVTGGSQDVIVERAKQEAQVIQRVTELRKEGMWTAKRLPRVQEPPRQKAHWDYLLEEMTWLAADFIQERKWKKATSKKIARMISNHFREKEMKELKAEKEEAIKLKKIASQMAKMVKEFWNNIEKVVQYKQTTRLEEKKKKALDLHLSFIVDQTEKYSSWLTAGLQSNDTMSRTSSENDFTDAGDTEFQPMGTASDDEETIEKEEIEAGNDLDGTKEELEALQKESELPLEEVLKSLPKEMLDRPSSGLEFGDDTKDDSAIEEKEKDRDFNVEGEDDGDKEETLEEQESQEKKDYTGELDDLKAEGELSVEELMKKYAGAYDSDFEMPEESSDEEGSDEDDDGSSGSEKETGESEDEEEDMEEDDKNSNEDESEAGKEAVGLEFLVKEEEKAPQAEQKNEEGPGKEFNDIAAAAQSLQPKGYTLETTEVKTKIPFLLKHTLREYQHVGLDWLATMHDKRLNGILADEMGLGKTIQTIALLAHLACEKGVWGPHLIVVPTSVMLNWEMEIKKWCPSFKILTYYGSIKERKLKRQGWTKTNAFHVCITSYKLVVQDHQAFRRKKWKYFILDEAQNIKNFKSQRWQMLLNFSSQRRLLLTGTPLQNSLMELWSLMHFLMPNVFQSHSEFKEWFSNPLTGMIEGSQEYNESLVRRLHKVLRPFLLRRLKNEVEKQMPQKFEHVVMCRLSKRQRFLYDDFMAQSKTKETLETGHFMSVINILMQLRKVCNHPNLFDPRPIISPFKMEGIVYRTASLAANALAYDPFRDIDLYCLYPSLVDLELDLPAFVAERVKRLQAPRKLIEEIDSWQAPEPRPPPGQLKNLKLASSVAAQQTDSNSTGTLSSRTSTSTIKATVAPTIQSSQSSNSNSIKLLLPSSSSPSAQQSILIPNPNGSGPPIILPLPASTTSSGASSVSSTSAAIAQAKLISSQLQSGLLHLVQTSSGHQVITVASTSASSSTSSNPITTTTSSLSSSSSSSVSVLKINSSTGSQEKPVMKVTPFVVSSSSDSGSSTTTLSKKNGSLDSPSVSKLLESHLDKVPKKPINRSELFLESLFRKKEERRQHILSHMAKINQHRCSISPVMGCDTRTCLQCFHRLNSTNSHSFSASSSSSRGKIQEPSFKWDGEGHTNCLFAQDRLANHNHPNIFWRECSHLVKAVRAPEDHIKQLQDILHRYVFVTPPVISPNIRMHVFHPESTTEAKMEWCESHLKPFIRQNSAPLHPIQLRTMVQFPEPRLIQYDCGKLQTMDILLRKLKSGQHRVLIFTQMTRMLDVLEAFLNFHGHRYLRLDGTTKVEQRQYLMDRFNADARIFCFILSTRSGGIGVNLTGADTVIFYDSDWNPTMDAQAQDRCHRIGQTRDVHIYRLVSEMTVEENILKKANQKRLLGDLAIEGGNFTTAFFKQQTISDLFAEPSGLESLVEAKEERMAAKNKKDGGMQSQSEPVQKEEAKQETKSKKQTESKKEDPKKETVILNQFEQALCKAEDEQDAQAAKKVQAEQKAELAEFDENIPWDEREAEIRKEEDEFSKVELELAMLDKELTPIERYAVLVVEAQTESETAEELKMAEEDIENSKKDWELARLKALKEEEERKAELEEDEMLYIYSKDESQTFISDIGGEEMPMWCPPTPPQDDNDIYLDKSLLFLYEGHTMPEQSLPPIFVPKTNKKPKMETITTRKQKQRKEEQPRVPRSLFDKPKEVVNKQRKEAKMQRLRHFQVPVPKMLAGRTPLGQQAQPQQAIVTKAEPDPNYPEWLVHEEWALLEGVQHIQKLNPDLNIDNPAQIANWDFVSDFVSVVGRIFRAPKHCRYQYENVVLPREDGRIMFNIKQKKSPKSIYKTKNTRPLRTEQIYSQDGLKNFSHLYKIRFEAMLEIGSKRPAPMRQTVNPAAKPTKHASILGENGINYDTPLPPSQLAMRRAERIAMDKKKQQQAVAAQQQAQAASNVAAVDQTTAQRTVQAGIVASGVTPAIQGQQLSSIVSVTSNTVLVRNSLNYSKKSAEHLAGQVPKVAVGPGLTAVSIARTIGATGNIIVNTPAGFSSGTFAAVNKRMNQLPTTIAVSANLTPTIRGQRTSVPGATAITMQEVGTIAVGASVSTTTVTVTSQAARSALQTTVASPSLATGTLTTQKLAAMATGTSGALQPQLVPHRSLTPQQINILRQNTLNIRGQSSPGTTQQLRAQKLLTTEQMRAQQQLKHPQKVITQQLLVPVRGGHSILQGKQTGLLRTTAIPHEQLQALRMRTTQIQTQQGKQLQTAQIIQGQVTAVGQSTASTSQSQVALVKSVSASPSITVPMTLPVTGISVGQQRTVVASRAATVSQIQQQQRMQLLHQQRKAGGQQKVTGLSTGKAGQIPLLIPQHGKLNSQILQQMGLVNKPIQQIIAHGSNQPTIITQVSQAGGQPITHMVAKVSLTTGGQQTLAAGTPITVTQASSTPGGVGLTVAGGQTVAASKTATITSLEGGSIQVHSVQPGQKSLSLAQSLVTAQNVQVQQATSNTSGTQVSQLLHVTPVSVCTSLAATTQGQTTSITVPTTQLVASASALRGATSTLLTSTASGTPQISLVTSPVTALTSAATPSTVQVQAISTVDVTSDGSLLATSAATSSPTISQSEATAGQKASPYTMRTRNAKH